MLDQYPDLLSTSDFQQILGIGRGLLYRLLNTNQIPAIRVGKRKWRIPKAAVIAYLKTM